MPLDRLIAASPEEVGIDADAMAALFVRSHGSPPHPSCLHVMSLLLALQARVEREVTEGRVEGCQVAIARNGRLAGRASFGSGGGKPVTDDTLFCCFSCTKATGAVAAWQLMEEGKLSLDQKVVDFIPDFGTHGKDGVGSTKKVQ